MFGKVQSTPSICAIKVSFDGSIAPSNIPEWQPFYNSFLSQTDSEKIYFGFGSVSFTEESENSNAGTSYKQTLTIQFPSTDKKRSERLAMLSRAKFIAIVLTSGLEIILGRNDIAQNARPKTKMESNIKKAQLQFQTTSIFPSGFTPSAEAFGLPLIPISWQG